MAKLELVNALFTELKACTSHSGHRGAESCWPRTRQSSSRDNWDQPSAAGSLKSCAPSYVAQSSGFVRKGHERREPSSLFVPNTCGFSQSGSSEPRDNEFNHVEARKATASTKPCFISTLLYKDYSSRGSFTIAGLSGGQAGPGTGRRQAHIIP